MLRVIIHPINHHSTKYIGLQILEKLITTRWKTLPDGQRQGIPYTTVICATPDHVHRS